MERTDRKSGNKKPEVTYQKYDAVIKLRIQVREDVLVLRRHLPFAPFVRQKTDSEKPPRVKKSFKEKRSSLSVRCVYAANTKGTSITVLLTSCLTGLDWSVLHIKTKIVSCHTANSKPVKQEVNGTVIIPPLVFPGLWQKSYLQCPSFYDFQYKNIKSV